MSGRIVVMGGGSGHTCPPAFWARGIPSEDEHEPHAPVGTLWRCDCGRTWKRVPRPMRRGQQLHAPFWRRERLGERLRRVLLRG